MPANTHTRPKEPKIDFDRLWKEAEAIRKEGEEARYKAWLRWMKEHQRDVPYSSWLVIPCNLADYGLRPLAPGTPFWASPFIWVDSPHPSGRPQAGAENFLVVQIFNFGAATAAPTKVDFYVKEPSLGLGADDPNIFEAKAEDYTSQWIEVQPMHPGGPPGMRFLRCAKPWIPTYQDNGHECAFVICDNHILDSAPRHPFEPWNDRRVGQRNLSLLPPVEQLFQVWAPMGQVNAPAEVRVLALRGIARGGFARRESLFATANHAAHEVLRGLRRTPAGTLPQRLREEKPVLVAERIPAERVIAGVRATDQVRAIRGAEIAIRKDLLATGGDLGERVLRLPDGPGAAVRLEFNLRPLELAANEIVVLNIVRVALGTVTGGYTLALVNPTWFDKSPVTVAGGNAMREMKEGGKELERLVIEHNPQARITFQIARQLEAHLPISAPEKLRGVLDEVLVDEHRLPLELFEPFLTPAIFPIRDVEDLVRKLTAATRFGLDLIAHTSAGTIQNRAGRALLEAGFPELLGARIPASVAYATRQSRAGQALFNSKLGENLQQRD